jgi:hypothetical protein
MSATAALGHLKVALDIAQQILEIANPDQREKKYRDLVKVMQEGAVVDRTLSGLTWIQTILVLAEAATTTAALIRSGITALKGGDSLAPLVTGAYLTSGARITGTLYAVAVLQNALQFWKLLKQKDSDFHDWLGLARDLSSNSIGVIRFGQILKLNWDLAKLPLAETVERAFLSRQGVLRAAISADLTRAVWLVWFELEGIHEIVTQTPKAVAHMREVGLIQAFETLKKNSDDLEHQLILTQHQVALADDLSRAKSVEKTMVAGYQSASQDAVAELRRLMEQAIQQCTADHGETSPGHYRPIRESFRKMVLFDAVITAGRKTNPLPLEVIGAAGQILGLIQHLWNSYLDIRQHSLAGE